MTENKENIETKSLTVSIILILFKFNHLWNES